MSIRCIGWLTAALLFPAAGRAQQRPPQAPLQIPNPPGLYPMYHGTLEARPLGTHRTTLYYTLVWDSSTQPDDAARRKQAESYHLLFEKMLRNMKKLAEGDALSPQDKQAPVDF